MKLYRLPVILVQRSEESGGKYIAEVPLLPGCRAWGDSAAEAVDLVHSVAMGFIESYREHGEPLPEGVEELSTDVTSDSTGELLIAV